MAMNSSPQKAWQAQFASRVHPPIVLRRGRGILRPAVETRGRDRLPPSARCPRCYESAIQIGGDDPWDFTNLDRRFDHHRPWISKRQRRSLGARGVQPFVFFLVLPSALSYVPSQIFHLLSARPIEPRTAYLLCEAMPFCRPPSLHC